MNETGVERADGEALAGMCDLAFAVRDGHSVTRHVHRAGNVRVSPRLPGADGVPYHLLVTTGGGFLEGERYRVRASLGPGAHAVLATQAPTYVYKCPGGGRAVQRVEAELGAGACLELYSDEVIPYRDARFSQLTEVAMAPDATLVLTDGLTCGWSPDGARFAFGEVTLHTRVVRGGKLAFNDCLHCAPGGGDPGRLGLFEGYAAFHSCVILDTAADQRFVEEVREFMARGPVPRDVRWGVSALESGGAVLRVLGNEAQHSRRAIGCFVAYFRERVKGLAPLDLRKNDSFVPCGACDPMRG